MKALSSPPEIALAAVVAPAPAERGALAGLALSLLLASLGTSIAHVSLPTLAHAFAAPFPEVQWVVLAYLVAVTALIVGAGRLGDLFGRRRLLLAGILLFTVASVGCGVAPTLSLLIAARAGQGLGAAVMMALSMAFVGDTVPKARMGRAMGVLGTMSAVGTALGPSVGGLLIAATGWRTIFLVNVPLGLAAYFLAWRHLPPDRRTAPAVRTDFDGAGTLLLALALAAYALALTIRGAPGELFRLVLLVLAAGLGGLFGWVELRSPSPLIRFAALREPGLRAGLLTSGLVSAIMMATLVVGPFHLSRGLGLGAAATGSVLAMGPLVAALTGVPAGRWVDRLGASRMTVLGLLGIAGGAVMLAVLPAAGGIAAYAGPIVVITASYAVFQTANNTAVLRDVAADQRGVVSGLLNLARNLGLFTGAAGWGAVFACAVRAADITTAAPAAVAAGMRTTFAAAAIVAGGALWLARQGRAQEVRVASEARRPT